MVAMVTSSGQQISQARYSAYGVPFGLPAGDADSDGDVDGSDSTLVSGWTGAYDVRGDLDLDGDVDFNDINAVIGLSGTTLGRGVLSLNPTVSTAQGSGNRKGYAGYEHDGAIHILGHVRNRVLHTALGRWLSRDPMGYIDGMSLYAYGRGAPLGHLDPSGRSAVDWTRPEVQFATNGGRRFHYCVKSMDQTCMAVAAPAYSFDVERREWQDRRNGSWGDFAEELAEAYESHILELLKKLAQDQIDSCLASGGFPIIYWTQKRVPGSGPKPWRDEGGSIRPHVVCVKNPCLGARMLYWDRAGEEDRHNKYVRCVAKHGPVLCESLFGGNWNRTPHRLYRYYDYLFRLAVRACKASGGSYDPGNRPY